MSKKEIMGLVEHHLCDVAEQMIRIAEHVESQKSSKVTVTIVNDDEKHAWDLYCASLLKYDGSQYVDGVARVADAMLSERRKRFGGVK